MSNQPIKPAPPPADVMTGWEAGRAERILAEAILAQVGEVDSHSFLRAFAEAFVASLTAKDRTSDLGRLQQLITRQFIRNTNGGALAALAVSFRVDLRDRLAERGPEAE